VVSRWLRAIASFASHSDGSTYRLVCPAGVVKPQRVDGQRLALTLVAGQHGEVEVILLRAAAFAGSTWQGRLPSLPAPPFPAVQIRRATEPWATAEQDGRGNLLDRGFDRGLWAAACAAANVAQPASTIETTENCNPTRQ